VLNGYVQLATPIGSWGTPTPVSFGSVTLPAACNAYTIVATYQTATDQNSGHGYASPIITVNNSSTGYSATFPGPSSWVDTAQNSLIVQTPATCQGGAMSLTSAGQLVFNFEATGEWWNCNNIVGTVFYTIVYW
jgi:hypothetical protein